MTLVPSDATAGRVGAHPWWAPRWLRRQREERELARWGAELGWQWTAAADVAKLTRHSQSAGKVAVTTAPQAHSVDPGPPVTLLVEMLPGQVVDDFQAQADRIAGCMGVSSVHIELYDPGWIKVVLLEDDP
ncbi:MAG: hypothetical protein ACRDRA_05700 [Pseudonocardiaceae bacterium]